MRYLAVHLRTTLNNLKSNRQVSLVTIATIAIAFSILGLFLVVFVNLDTFLTTWSREVQLVVYLDDSVSSKERESLERAIAGNPDVESIAFVSRETAWENFKNTFSAKSEFLKSLEINPLPASFNVQFKQTRDRVEKIRQFAETLRKSPGVESLEYGEKWIGRFEKFMVFLKVFLLAIGGLLGLGLIFIISNTIKLSLYSRQDEIELMLMVGATHGYIKAPFLMEGVAQALIGALISVGVIKFVHIHMKLQFQDTLEAIARGGGFLFVSFSQVLFLLLASAAVGWAGSYLSINQFLNSIQKR
ncbi:MAG: ABC transporter permease [Nitrospinae bacterium]|nr:ABC transporter permease [Nitrospinota bacterium]